MIHRITFHTGRMMTRTTRRCVPRGLAVAVAVTALLGGCVTSQAPALPAPSVPAVYRPGAAEAAFIDTLSRRTFDFFWETTNPRNGLTPDRWPSKSFSSVAAVGFALTAYPIGVERGWITRDAARERVLTTLRFFWTAPQGPQQTGVTGHHGFFYHFLDMETGRRFDRVELSTIDTALLLAGALTCREYFSGDTPGDREVRSLADSLYARADWQWASNGGAVVRGYDEGMLLYVLALGSPTHPIDAAAWSEWTRTYKWEQFQGREYVQFAPLFGHQYSHIWVDFRGIRDAPMRAHHSDYFTNSVRATYAQRVYATANPLGFRGYGPRLWGLTACDGPLDSTLELDGRDREFHTYEARGASMDRVTDDGTVSPSAAGGSIAFAPDIVLPVLMAMRHDHGSEVFGQYGFVDALNPTLHVAMHTHHGHVVDGKSWYDTDYLGIDEGPILAMTENYRSGLVWRYMRRNPYIVRGLWRAGFTGGWLAHTGVAP